MKNRLRVWIPVLILFIAGIVIVLKFSEPPLPRHFVLATGDVGGAYYAYGQQYEQLFAKDKITIDVRATAGSIENLKWLDSGQADIGFVQGGVSHQVSTANNLCSLASVYYEPLWVFYRGEEKVEELTQFIGKRIGIGEDGSGTQVVAELLLDMNGVSEENAELLPMGFENATTALEEGRIDIGLFVAAPEASVIHRLLRMEGVHLMSFRRYSAYARKLSFLKGIVIPEGLFDFKQNIPRRDIVLLSTTATLVSRSDLHPRLVEHVLKTIAQVHKQKGILQAEGEFPSPQYVDFPLHKAAERYFRAGPSFLSRYLPFWALMLISRLKILILPALTLLLPLMKFAPIAYRWGMGKRIYKWYNVLHEVEESLKNESSAELLAGGITRLKGLHDEVTNVSVPSSYRKEAYDLRMHINLVVEELERRMGK